MLAHDCDKIYPITSNQPPIHEHDIIYCHPMNYKAYVRRLHMEGPLVCLGLAGKCCNPLFPITYKYALVHAIAHLIGKNTIKCALASRDAVQSNIHIQTCILGRRRRRTHIIPLYHTTYGMSMLCVAYQQCACASMYFVVCTSTLYVHRTVRNPRSTTVSTS